MQPWIIVLFSLNFFCIVLIATLYWRRERSYSDREKDLVTRNSPIPLYRDAHSTISGEISRARRFHHRLSVTVFRLAQDNFSGGGRPKGSPKTDSEQLQEVRFLLLGSILRDELRVYDILAFDPANDQYVVLLVETNRRQATQLVRRIGRLIWEKTNLNLVAGIAEFPYSGLIIEDLVAKAGENCQISEHGTRAEENVRLALV